MLPLDAVDDPQVVEKARTEIERLEASTPDGFNTAIRTLMTYQLPQLPSELWPE